MENIISSLHDDGIEYIEERVSGMSLVERQIFFVNCIKVIDKSYYDYTMTKSDQSATLFFDILKYAYPVLIKYLWTKDFETLIATPLARADSDEIYRCRVFLCSCKIVGQTEYILDMVYPSALRMTSAQSNISRRIGGLNISIQAGRIFMKSWYFH